MPDENGSLFAPKIPAKFLIMHCLLLMLLPPWLLTLVETNFCTTLEPWRVSFISLFSSASDTDSVVLIYGIGLHSFSAFNGIDLIMGNNLGCDCVFPHQFSPSRVVSTGVLSLPE